jgi:hypothetical protein
MMLLPALMLLRMNMITNTANNSAAADHKLPTHG